MHNMPNLEADGYSNRRQNMVQEQETKAAIKTKIGQKIEKKKTTLPALMNLLFCCDIQIAGSEFCVRKLLLVV